MRSEPESLSYVGTMWSMTSICFDGNARARTPDRLTRRRSSPSPLSSSVGSASEESPARQITRDKG
jgi:hypothetical protein